MALEKDLTTFVDTNLPDSYFIVAIETVLDDDTCHGCWFLCCNDFYEEFGDRQWLVSRDPSRAHRFESAAEYKAHIQEAFDSIESKGEKVLGYMPVRLNITMLDEVGIR